MVYSDNSVTVGGVVYPLLNPCHNVVGKTGLVVVTVQGAPPMLVNGCHNQGSPELESCMIWCQAPLYRQTGMACLFATLSLLSQNNWMG